MSRAVLSAGPKAVMRRQRAGAKVVRTTRVMITTLFGFLVAINIGAVVTASSPFILAHLAAALLAIYLLLEARLYLRRADSFGLISPAFLALPLHFALSYLVGITVAIFHPRVMERFGYWMPDLDASLAGTMFLAMLAAFSMLRGYGFAQPLARKLRRSVRSTPQFRFDFRPVFGLVLATQVVYLGFVAYAINLGVYGLLSTPESLARHASIVQFMNLFLAAGTLSYFLILLRFFQLREQGSVPATVWVSIIVLIALHVAAGALAAFKSQMVFPFIIAGFAYYLATRRVPIRFIGLAFVALVSAYVVIEPYRTYIDLRGKPPDSALEAVSAITNAVEMREHLSHDSDLTRGEAIASRVDLAGMTAIAVDYVDSGALQVSKRREFQESMLFAPVLAFVPRAVWPSKPSYSQGVWFNQTVRGRWNDKRTSVGMGPIGYLYMAGGVIAVALGFFGFGMLQALIFDGVGRSGAGGLIIFISVASTLVSIPSSFGPAVTGVLRMLPIAFVAQLFLLRPTHQATKSFG